MPSPTGFVSVNLKREARDALQTAAYRLTGSAGRRVTLSEALVALAGLSERHQAELVRELRGES